jgi:hypothetical protein
MKYRNPVTFMHSLQHDKLLPAGRCVHGDNKQIAIIGLFSAELKTMIYKGRLRNDNDHEE